MFIPVKNRDAWATIRGFVYQVDLTINRWLALTENQVLELEKGEDIDIVSKSLSGKEDIRVLEQIKHRESDVSLNQGWVLEILLTFYRHKQNNPEQNLLFRFVTNAKYTIERPAIIPKGEGGITMWNQLRSQDVIEPQQEEYLAIKTHLQKKTAIPD